MAAVRRFATPPRPLTAVACDRAAAGRLAAGWPWKRRASRSSTGTVFIFVLGGFRVQVANEDAPAGRRCTRCRRIASSFTAPAATCAISMPSRSIASASSSARRRPMQDYRDILGEAGRPARQRRAGLPDPGQRVAVRRSPTTGPSLNQPDQHRGLSADVLLRGLSGGEFSTVVPANAGPAPQAPKVTKRLQQDHQRFAFA